jgi:hypothetical protein
MIAEVFRVDPRMYPIGYWWADPRWLRHWVAEQLVDFTRDPFIRTVRLILLHPGGFGLDFTDLLRVCGPSIFTDVLIAGGYGMRYVSFLLEVFIPVGGILFAIKPPTWSCAREPYDPARIDNLARCCTIGVPPPTFLDWEKMATQHSELKIMSPQQWVDLHQLFNVFGAMTELIYAEHDTPAPLLMMRAVLTATFATQAIMATDDSDASLRLCLPWEPAFLEDVARHLDVSLPCLREWSMNVAVRCWPAWQLQVDPTATDAEVVRWAYVRMIVEMYPRFMSLVLASYSGSSVGYASYADPFENPCRHPSALEYDAMISWAQRQCLPTPGNVPQQPARGVESVETPGDFEQ